DIPLPPLIPVDPEGKRRAIERFSAGKVAGKQKGPGLFGSLFGRKKNKKNKEAAAAPLPSADYPKDPAPTTRVANDIRVEPVEIHYDLPEEPIVEKREEKKESNGNGMRKESNSNGVTTIEIPPIQIDEEVIIEIERREKEEKKEGKEERKDSSPPSQESRKRVPAPPPPLSPELQQQLQQAEVKYSIKKPSEQHLSPSSHTSEQLRDLASSGTSTPQPTREVPIPRGIVVEIHPNHPAVRSPREETTREYSRREERIRERVEEEEFPRFIPAPPSVSPMPKLPAMRVTVDRRPPSPPPPAPLPPVTRVVESRREYSRDTVVMENRSRTVVRTKEVVRENAPSLSEEERMLQKKYDHLKAKFDRWQYLKSTDKENPETKKLQSELMVEHDRVVSLLSSLYPTDSSAASSLKGSPQPSRNGQMKSPVTKQEAEKKSEAPRLDERTERKKREAPAPNPSSPSSLLYPSSPTPSSSGLSSHSASSSLSSPNSGGKYTRDLNDNLVRRPQKEVETTERRKKSSVVETRDERAQKSSRPKSLLIPAPDYDATPIDYNRTSTLNQSEFFGPSIPYYDTRARTISDPKSVRKESTSSYGSSTISRRDQPRSQVEWEIAEQMRAEEELRRVRKRQQHVRESSSASHRSTDSSTYKTLSSGKSNGQSEARSVVQDAGRLSLDSTKQAKRVSRDSPPVVYGERSFTLPKKSSLPAPPPLSSSQEKRETERTQENVPRMQEPRMQSVPRPSALPPTPPVVVMKTATHEVIRPTPVKAVAAPPPPTTAAPTPSTLSTPRDVPIKMVGPSREKTRETREMRTPMTMNKEDFSTARLNKVGPPREQNVVALGRVLDSPAKTPSSSIPPAPPLPPVLPPVSSPSSIPAAPPPPPPAAVSSPRTPITAEALKGVTLKPAKERPVQTVKTPTTTQTSTDIKDQLMAQIRGGVALRKVNSPAKVQ
ncbi:hypothetical protein PMAYCL1PPCAC_12924, partial [Pristionchus mayeri]